MESDDDCFNGEIWERRKVMNIHEELFVKNFIVSRKRERYIELLGNEKTRSKITVYFDHCPDLEDKYKSQIPVNQQNAKDIYRILKNKGAPETCFAISNRDQIDGKELSLRKVIDEYYFDNSTFISCIPGKLIYYASEEINGCYILEKS